MNNWGANHCVMTAGHVGHLYLTLASMLRIPVYMHNVEENRFFGPVPGVALVPMILKERTFGHARLTVRCTVDLPYFPSNSFLEKVFVSPLTRSLRRKEFYLDQ